MPVEIRQVHPGDEALFERIAADVFDAPVRPGRLSAYLAGPGHIMIVALDDGVIVGQAAGVVHRHPDKPTELYVDEVGVAPARQRQGIARRMLDELFAIGRSLGCEEAWVGTEPDNVPARRFYETRPETAEPAQDFVMYVYEL
ncbi:GNAT family N-acetyltransferase [Kumtagia ephedrae]|uniref:GNAT family N-acetyltransferase n=1 Tax=Kumtagia ephedrae TaxID=2116701 RepID=A0A2P7S8B0_9HYPH|nr:GNAT family N-acetyltransferase [Mesorhizobium ephedrae]PSJ58671.1 GNAT family N-acetyltransferase [Mesorhizobium ephedrae]